MMFLTYLTVVVMYCLLITHAVGIRFVIDRGECLSHIVDHEGNTVHVSFVVIKAESPWHFSEDGVDFVVIFLMFIVLRTFFIIFCNENALFLHLIFL